MIKKYRLKSQSIENFRGIKSLHIDYTDKTIIRGTNRSGKSTLLDAHNWLWTGKDTSGSDNAEIKPRDKNGKITPKIDVVVSEEWDLDGAEFSIKRVFSEEWNDATEDKPESLRTTKTLYYIDGALQKTEKDFNARTANIITPELFRILSSPEYFLSLKHIQQREILLKLVGGNMSNSEIIASNPKLEGLAEILTRKTFEQYEAEVDAKIKAAEKQKLEIKPKLNEATLASNKIHQEFPDLDFEAISADILVKQDSLEILNEAILNASEGNEFKDFAKNKLELGKLELKLSGIEQTFTHNKQQKDTDINSTKIPFQGIINRNAAEIKELERTVALNVSRLSSGEAVLKLLQDEYDAKDSEIYKPDEIGAKCSYCDKPFTEHELEEKSQTIWENWNEIIVKDLDKIAERGVSRKAELSKIEQESENAKIKIEELTIQSEEAQKSIDLILPDKSLLIEVPEFISVSAEIEAVKVLVENPPVAKDEELNVSKSKITEEIADLNKKLGLQVTLKNQAARVLEINAEGAAIDKVISNYKRAESLVKMFSFARTTSLETKVNSAFKHIKFELFKYNQDGKQNEWCMPTLNGVHFPTVNKEGKITMFMDVINTFSNAYSVKIPTWVDDFESIVIDLPEIDNQMIFLQANADYPTLQVFNN